MLAAEQSTRTHVTTEMNIEETPLDLAESRDSECDSIHCLLVFVTVAESLLIIFFR